MSKVQSAISADTNDGGANSVATQAFGANFTANNFVWGHVSWLVSSGPTDLTDPGSSISDGTNSYTVDQITGPDVNGICCATFHKENAASVVTPVITVTFATGHNPTFRRVRGEERSGVATTSAVHKKAAQFSATFGTGTDAATSGAQVTTIDGCQVVGVGYDDSAANIPTVGTGYASTDSATFAAGDAFRTEDRTQATQGSIAATFTLVAGTDITHVHMLALAPSAAGPTIDKQPENKTTNIGATPTFSVAATASSGSLSYQWQDNSSGIFADITGATSADYTTPPTTYAMRGRQYKCNVTDGGGSTLSAPATLIVNWSPSDVYMSAVPADASAYDVRLYDPTVTLGGAFQQALSGTLSFVGATTRRTGKSLGATLSFIGTKTQFISKGMTAALSFVGLTTKRTSTARAATLSFVGSLASTKLFVKALTAALSFTGSVSFSTRKALTATLSFVGTRTSFLSKILAPATLSFVGAVTKRTLTQKAATLSFVGAQTRRVSHLLTASLGFVGDLQTQVAGLIQKSLTATLSFSGSVTKRTSFHLTAALSFVGLLGRQIPKGLTASLSFVGSLSKRTGKQLSAALSFVGAQTRQTRKSLVSALSFVGSLATQAAGIITMSLTATLSFGGSLTRSTSKKLAANLPFVGTMTKLTLVTKAASLSFSGAITRRISKLQTATLGFIGVLQKQTRKAAFTASLSFSGLLAGTTQIAKAVRTMLFSFLGRRSDKTFSKRSADKESE